MPEIVSVHNRRGDPFAGAGEVRALARAVDWSSTSLGPVEGWSQDLKTVVRTSLDSPFPINLWCGPHLILIYNDAYREVLGAKHPAALGRPGSQVWTEIWHEIAPMFERIRSGEAIYADDAPFVMRRSDDPGHGPEHREPNAWFTFSLSPVRDERGEIIAYLNIVSETTRRLAAEQESALARARAEQAESRVLEMFAQAPAFMALLRGPDHVFEYANDAYEQLVGQRKLVGLAVADALPEIKGQGFEDLLDRVRTTGEAYVGREMPIFLTRKSGAEPEETFVDFVYYPITEADGTPSGVVAHGSDVTEHVLARREAQRARAEAEEANQAKSQFLATMSHEIRTPINAIIGYTELLSLEIGGSLTEKQHQHLERVRTSSEHLISLINDILDLSKAESGRMDVAHEQEFAANAISAALEIVGPQAEANGVSLIDRSAGETGALYVGDDDRVRQIIINLLSNAIKFTGSGGTIGVTYGTTRDVAISANLLPDEEYTYVRVEDTGAGIDPDQMDAIFRPFIQAESGHTRTRGGTGLGLTISRQLARLMGGDLTAKSEPGKGSTFTLWLPTQFFTPPLVDLVTSEPGAPLPPGLPKIGKVLRASIDPIIRSYTARLREDTRFGHLTDLPRATLEDHAAAFLADIAQNLASLEDNPADLPELLRDGSEIQQVIAKLHGAQRARLGWTEAALSGDFEILREEIDAAIRRTIPHAGDLTEEMSILRRFLEHSEQQSRLGWRQGGGLEVRIPPDSASAR